MKINDLITEAPMGLGKTLTTKLKSFVPGSTGARAKGELDIGKVANQWKKDYANFLGRLGAEGYGNTKTLISFLKTLGFTHKQMNKVFKGGGFTEASQVYEASLSSRMIDTLMTRAARVGAMAAMGVDQPLPKEPNPTAPRKPGAIDTAVNIGKQVAPHIAKAAGKVGQTIGNKISQAKSSNLRIGSFKKSPKTISPRIEPTLNEPPRDMPNLVKPVQQPPKFNPARKPPRMGMKKSVTRYK